MQRSRLSRKLEKQSKNNLIFSILGILIVFLILFKFGVPFLINFSLLVSGTKNSSETVKNDTSAFISAPVLNPLPTATNSAKTTISGIASSDQTISLYLNDEVIDKMKTEKDGSFSFKEIILDKGENTIKTKAVTKDNKLSDFSETVIINYKSDPTTLSIDNPSDGQSFSKDESPINIVGKTDPGVKVTINDLWAIVNSNGNFSYKLPLQNGENTIKIVATDEAGNKTELERKVNYSP